MAQDKPTTISDDPLMIAALKAVDEILAGLSGSDFISEHGAAPITTLGTYRVDMACDIVSHVQNVGAAEFQKLEDELANHEHLGGLAQIMDNNPDLQIELFETGSVTVIPAGLDKKYVLSLRVQEEK